MYDLKIAFFPAINRRNIITAIGFSNDVISGMYLPD